MKSSRLVVLLTILFFGCTGLSACASSDINPRGHAQSQGDAANDAQFGGDGSSSGQDIGTSDTAPLDAGAADAHDAADVGVAQDTAPAPDVAPDTAPADVGVDTAPPGPCASVRCSADTVCDPGTGTCVDCLGDGDCSGGMVCDTSTSSCVECLGDVDCGAGAHCDLGAQACIPSCCSNVTQQEAFSSTAYSHNRFDIDVDDQGTPAIVFLDGSDNTVKYAQPVNGQWMSQDVTTVSQSLSSNVRLALGPNGNPHVILARYQYLKHFWRDQSGWHSEDLISNPPSVGYDDIAVDDQGGVHMIALVGYGDRVVYAYRSPQGQLSTEDLTLPGSNPPVWVNLAVTSDGRPIASFQIGLDKTLVVAEKSAGGTWSYETPGQDVSQVHGMAVGPDDEPVIAYRKDSNNDGLHLLRRQGRNWSDDLIVANANHGFTPDVAVDSLGNPHVIYMANGATQYDNPLYYARWNGVDWEHDQITGVDRAFYPRIAVDANRVPHVVVYDPSRDTITYLKIQ